MASFSRLFSQAASKARQFGQRSYGIYGKGNLGFPKEDVKAFMIPEAAPLYFFVGGVLIFAGYNLVHKSMVDPDLTFTKGYDRREEIGEGHYIEKEPHYPAGLNKAKEVMMPLHHQRALHAASLRKLDHIHAEAVDKALLSEIQNLSSQLQEARTHEVELEVSLHQTEDQLAKAVHEVEVAHATHAVQEATLATASLEQVNA